MSEWQPISTVPRDGTVVDLWMVNERRGGKRVTDAYFVTNRRYQQPGWTEDGKSAFFWCDRDGWWAPNFDYGGQDGWCDTPLYFNAHPNQHRDIFELPTHWMPTPKPPNYPGGE